MVDVIVRSLKRFVVFVPGIAITYLVVRDLYPIINRRLPAAVAILAVYVATAYAFIPAGVRVLRLVIKAKHVPFYSVTPDGFASDPINVAVLASRETLIKAFTTIGWHVAEPRTLLNTLRLIMSVVLQRSYPTAPFSSLYLFGRSQDIGLQLPVADNPGERHHVRFWAVKPAVAEKFEEDVAFWQTHNPSKQKLADKFLWLGAASLDIGLGVIRHNAQLTHMIHHDTNAERKLIVDSLKQAGLVKNVRTVQIASPYQLRNRVLTGYFEADGKLTIIEL